MIGKKEGKGLIMQHQTLFTSSKLVKERIKNTVGLLMGVGEVEEGYVSVASLFLSLCPVHSIIIARKTSELIMCVQ